MRFPIFTKTTLLAAALAGGAVFAQASAYNSTLGTNFANYSDRKIEVNSDTNMTISTEFFGSGTFVKSGGGTLELWGHVALSGPCPVFDANSSESGSVCTSATGSYADITLRDQQYPDWTSGELVVESGVLQLSGFVNLWRDYGSQINSLVPGIPLEGEMSGVDKITIWNGAYLDVGQSRFLKNDSIGSGARMAGDNVFVFLNNLRAGDRNDQSNSVLNVGQNNGGTSRAADDIYHVNIHIEAWDSGNSEGTLREGGSVGNIIGNANIYKTGEGKLTMLSENKAYTGKFFVAGGSVVLNADADKAVSVDVTGALKANGYGDLEYGRTLWNAGSLTIAGTIDPQNASGNGAATSSLSEASRLGADVRVRYESTRVTENNSLQIVFYKEAYFPDPSAGTLVVNNNEAIRNFQSMFSNGIGARDNNFSVASAIQNAADVLDKDAPIVAGTGIGSYLAVKEGSVLAIYQEDGMGGIYKGTICGVNASGDAAGVNSDGTLVKGGTVVKYGDGDLALVLQGANYEKLALLDGGKVVVNITAIDLDPGSYDWTKGETYNAANWAKNPGLYVGDDVNFTLVENAAETLKTRINLKDVHFSTVAFVDTVGGVVDVSDGRKPGTVELGVEQRFVTGEVFVERGLSLVLTAQDLAGYTDADGNYRYYDINGSGTYTTESGEVYDNVSYYKNSDGERVYYYIDKQSGRERVISSADEVRLEYTDSVEFSGGSIGGAKAVILAGKVGTEADLYAGSQISTLSFNNTNQKINNLTGDAYSKVDLGRSTLTVNTTLDASDGVLALSGETENGDVLTYSRFSGAVSGIGNIIKTGAKTLTLDGGSLLSYMGATALQEGAIDATKSQSLWNSSLIWMNTNTVATFAGAQNLVTLVGGNGAELSLENGDLQLGTDASRRSVLNSAYQATDGATLGVIVTNELGNSDRILKTYPGTDVDDSEALVRTYLKPILDFRGAGLTDGQATALVAYFQNDSLGTAESSALKELFGHDVERNSLTVADITRLYVRLLAQNGASAVPADLAETIERLSFDGTLTANNITKIGDDRFTVSGSINAKSLKIVGGTVEMDIDAFDSTTFADGISVSTGATLSINTGSDPEGDYVFDKSVSGDGNFEKKGSGKLIFGDAVNYFGQTVVADGDLTMTLRSRSESDVKAQGNITVSNASSNLTFEQSEASVVWAGTLTNAGNLIKEGTGSLTLNGSTTLEGNLSVAEGELVLADAEFAGSGKTISVSLGATLALSESVSTTIDRKIEGEGLIEKSGAGELTLVNTASDAGVFVGTLSVLEGDLRLGTENLFAFGTSRTAGVSVNVVDGGTLYLEKNQSFLNLTGNGTVLLNTDAETTLSLALGNENSVAYTNSNASYVTTVNRAVSTAYSSFGSYTGDFGVYGGNVRAAQLKIGGNGTFVFDGDLEERISFSVADSATLITSVLDRNISLLGENARVILATDSDDVRLDGEISAENIAADGAHKIGKIGTGTLTIESSNAISWIGADLQVLEGTLRLEGSDAFKFNSAVVVADATLALECGYGVVPKLSEIEGSGTVMLLETESSSSQTLELTGASMLSSTAVAGGRYFNGILDAGAFKISVTGTGVKLASLQTTGGLETSEQVVLAQNHDTTIGGSFNANIVVSGQGCLKIEDVRATGTILVDNGKIQVNAEASKLNNTPTGGVRVKNDATVYFTVDNDRSSTLSDVEVRLTETGKAGTVSLIKSGEASVSLAFDGVADGGQRILSVSDSLWAETTSGNARLLVGVDQGELIVSGLASLDSTVGFTTQANSAKSPAGTFVILAAEADEVLSRTITGTGNVAFRGVKTTSVAVNQAYTGETTIEDGATVNFENVSLATSSLNIESGAVMKGGVKLVGTKKISMTPEVRATNVAETIVGGNFVNNGTVILNVNNGDAVEYAGTFRNDGVIRLTGVAAATRGTELVLFKSLAGKTYSTDELTLLLGNGKLTNGATALMLLQSDTGVISAYAVGTSFAETKGLNDGLAGSFTDVLDKMGGVGEDVNSGIIFESELRETWGPIGVALNQTSAGTLPGEIANLSPIGYASMIAMARNSFENDWRAISERASHRRYDSTNELYDNGVEFFARAQASIVENASGSDSANFDFNTYGAVIGFDVKPDDFSLYGFTLGYDYGSADLHNGGGKIRSDSFRATAFASGLLGDGSIFLDLGVHAGLNSYDVDRNTLVGKSEGETDGWNVGVAATLGKGFLLKKEKNLLVYVTPYVGVSYLFTKIDSFDESGVAGLDVDSFDAHSVRGRLGATVDWKFPLGDWDARISLDVAYHHEFVDDEADVDAQFKQYSDTAFRVSGIIGSSDAFSVAPSMTIDLSERDSLSFGYMLQYGTDEQINHNLNVGFRHCF